MVAAGAGVAIGDLLDERGRETVRTLEAAGGEALYVHLDVTRAADWAAAIAAAVGRFGGLDILVNNAGVFIAKGIEESTAADWERLCGVNLTGEKLGVRNGDENARRLGRGNPLELLPLRLRIVRM